MALRDIIKEDYFKLFIKREGKVVLGVNYSNLWLLCTVLTVTFLAIGFSNASLDYLSYKMNDPFINWVDIKNPYGEADFSGFTERLVNDQDELMPEYHYKGSQTDKYWYTTFFSADNDSKNLRCRYFQDIQTPLVDAIMSNDNVIDGCRISADLRDNESFGVIITLDALKNKLGYDEIPSYINYWAYCDPEAEDEFGVEIVEGTYAKVPVPVLAVVKRLPTNMDIIGTKHFYNQNLVYSLNLYNEDYFSRLIYFVPGSFDADKLVDALKETAEERGLGEYDFDIDTDGYFPHLTSWRDGVFVSFDMGEDDVDYEISSEINSAILDKFSMKGVVRVFDYEDNEPMPDSDDYVSIHFSDLNQIRQFQEFTKNEYGIDIEMSQINAKDNFNQVRIMANILSWTMIVFAIICIILFIVNLLQSYFQKVKRNLGTFKAFGISDSSLISIYVLIMSGIIITAVIIAVLLTGFVQSLFPLFGIMKEGTFNYIDLWSLKTVLSIFIILVSSIYTVYVVMKGLLKVTPGDLIYDR